MEYRNLGNAGVKVSSLCFGTMTFGDGADEMMSQKLYSACRDAGINFYDCANVYAKGESERILGKLISGHRDEVIIATKGYYPMSKDVNAKSASRFQLTKALEGSLKRMETDYVDIYYIHHFDEDTSLEETLSTLNDFVRQGKVLYLGLSNFSAWQIMKASGICEKNGWAHISCIQPMYSLLKRQCETELLPMAMSKGIGVCPYSPLGGGYLTGKYLEGNEGKGRFDTSKMYQNRYKGDEYIETVQRFVSYAKKTNTHPVSLAVKWANMNPAISSTIIGAKNLDQLQPALASIEIEMSEGMRSEISSLSSAPALATDREEEREGGEY